MQDEFDEEDNERPEEEEPDLIGEDCEFPDDFDDLDDECSDLDIED